MASRANAPATTATPSECDKAAMERQRPYVIDSVGMVVRLEKSQDSAHPVMESNRTVYSIRALRDLAGGPQETTLTETYPLTLPDGLRFTRISGSDTERDHPKENKESDATTMSRDVMFTLAKGQVRTIITGQDVLYPAEERSGMPGGTVVIGRTQDLPVYHNVNDVVCEVTMLVESASLPLKAVGKAAKRGMAEQPVTEASVPAAAAQSISYRWQKLLPGEEVGLLVGW